MGSHREGGVLLISFFFNARFLENGKRVLKSVENYIFRSAVEQILPETPYCSCSILAITLTLFSVREKLGVKKKSHPFSVPTARFLRHLHSLGKINRLTVARLAMHLESLPKQSSFSRRVDRRNERAFQGPPVDVLHMKSAQKKRQQKT